MLTYRIHFGSSCRDILLLDLFTGEPCLSHAPIKWRILAVRGDREFEFRFDLGISHVFLGLNGEFLMLRTKSYSILYATTYIVFDPTCYSLHRS